MKPRRASSSDWTGLIRCTWHESEVLISEAVQNGTRLKCRKCYNSERFLQSNYKKQCKSHVWINKSIEDRRAEIVAVSSQESTQGKKRSFQVSESTSVKDSMASKAVKPHPNRRQFEQFGRDRWAWTAEEADRKWAEAMQDPSVAKGFDDEGHPTVARYSDFPVQLQIPGAHKQDRQQVHGRGKLTGVADSGA